MPRYTLNPGRRIDRDGKPFVTIQGIGTPHFGDAPENSAPTYDPVQADQFAKAAVDRMNGQNDALSNALNMLRTIADNKSFDANDFYTRVTELECALDPSLKPGEAMRRFTERLPHRS